LLVYEDCHGVTFFEDSIIIPTTLEGFAAGGKGADTSAKILELVASKIENISHSDISNLLIKLSSNMPESLKGDYEKLLFLVNKVL
jgi:hypothetical protein